MQLLLLSAYLDINNHQHVQQLCNSALNWTEVLSLSKKWAVHAYLFHCIESNRMTTHVPENEYQALKQMYQRQVMQTLYLKRQLHELQKQFTQNNIPFCLIKGAELIDTIYQNMPVRPMSDIDILCHPKDISKIQGMLNQMGYYQKSMHQSHELQMLASHRKHFPAFFHDSRHTIEIHFNIFPDATDQEDLTRELWNAARPEKSSTQFHLNPLHHFMYLCHHLAYHILSPREGLVLYWFFDIYQWMLQYQNEVTTPFNLSLDTKTLDRIHFVLNIVFNEWGRIEGFTEAGFNENINGHQKISLCTIIQKHTEEDVVEKKKRILSYYWQIFFDKDPKWSFKTRLLYWFRLFFPQVSYLRDRYQIQSQWALPIYGLCHPLIVLGRAIKRLVRP